MLKKSLILLAIICIFLVTGCNGSKQDIGGFFGELACLTAENDGQITPQQIADVANNHGFETETSVQEIIQTQTDDEKQKEVGEAVDYVAANCQANFEQAGIDPEAFLTEFLATY